MHQKMRRHKECQPGPNVPGTLLATTEETLYFSGGQRIPVSTYHRPAFFAFTSDEESIRSKARRILAQAADAPWDSPLRKILDISPPFKVKSYTNPGKELEVVKVWTRHPQNVPDISTELFQNWGCYTAEHDVLYVNRVLADLAGDDTASAFNTRGQIVELRILCYDIETTQFKELGDKAPADVIAYSDFTIKVRSTHDLESEKGNFEVIEAPKDFLAMPVRVHVNKTPEEEVAAILDLVAAVKKTDITAGHNLLLFDNDRIVKRIQHHLSEHAAGTRKLPDATLHQLQDFAENWTSNDRAFLWGNQEELTAFLPTSLDTYLVSKALFKHRESHTLKDIAKDLGVIVPGRVYLNHEDLNIEDPKTIEYAVHDVQEQIGITLRLLPQALTTAFLEQLPLEKAFDNSTTNIWDHMSLVRGNYVGKLFPSLCQPKRFLASIMQLGAPYERVDLADRVRKLTKEEIERHPKDLLRVMKGGTEAPEWVEYAHGLMARTPDPELNEGGKRPKDWEPWSKAADFVGGLALKPQDSIADGGADSHFIPWYDVMTADVAAMYPSILKARNSGGDSVRIARKDETPTAWTWFYNLGEGLLCDQRFVVRRVDPVQDSFTAARDYRGYMVGIVIDAEPALACRAMGGILAMSSGVKARLNEEAAKEAPDQILLGHLKALYASVKPLRNSGTHGILSSFTTSCRQFNPMAGGYIPTVGQEILVDVKDTFQTKSRLVYMDTDGLYFGGSRSAYTNPRFAKMLGEPDRRDPDAVISSAEDMVATIKEASRRWQEKLNYPGFELDAEPHGAMLFHSHKNYVMLDVKKDEWHLTLKGANFKGSDKPPIVLKTLKGIILKAILDVPRWETEAEGRAAFQAAVGRRTQEAMVDFKVENLSVDELVVRQSVKPAGTYKVKANGGESDHASRTRALEAVLGVRIASEQKMRLLCSKKPLPGIENPNKTDNKALDYNWPAHLVAAEDLDVPWYRRVTETYVSARLNIGASADDEDEDGMTVIRRGAKKLVVPADNRRQSLLAAYFT